MWFEQLLFFFAAAGALGGAIGVVVVRNPFFSVLALVAHLLSLAVLFLLLRAEFLAAAQVVVYAGAVMVLYVFVVAYIGGVDEPLGEERAGITKVAPLFALALLVEICVAVLGTGLTAIDGHGAHVAPGFGSPAEIGRLLLERFLLAFEAASFLLLVAAVGAVVLARRRRGLEETDGDELPQPAPAEAPIPLGSGGPSSIGESTPTRIPAGTAEGPADPTVERSPDHETQETPEPETQEAPA
ncbi:MAG: NADH-quinone oxidoreductase subunit [Thermoleophilaceae bacterium]|jgi:NADH-quinone oxidoreductase subunit J|nr:NADH-quinone oxidoreductase subunit [Thermoleophilaceae bacterium]MEA2471933.1 NADH-quinone oxidoreductase subunit [Thermoleophilaceae bacterium]